LPRSRDAEAFVAALKPWMPDGAVHLYPSWEVLPGEAMSPTLDTMGRRIRVVNDLSAGRLHGVVVTAVRALLQKAPLPDESEITLQPGVEIHIEDLQDRLGAFGYEKNYLVERPGEFAVRGGILDVFPPGRERPVRADFFGDEISELKEFSVSSQRSHDAVDVVVIAPCRELRPTLQVKERAARLAADAPEPELAGDFERIANGVVFPGMEAHMGLLLHDMKPLPGLLPDGGAVVVLDPKQCSDRAADFIAQAEQWAPHESASLFVGLDEAVAGVDVIRVWPFGRGEESPTLEVKGWESHAGRPDKLAADLRLDAGKKTTVVVSGGRASARIHEVLSEAGLGLPVKDGEPGEAFISNVTIERGFHLELSGHALKVVGESDLFGRRRHQLPSVAETPARASALLLELASGDFVVHETYGVGRYHGMATRELGGITRDYLIIEYHGDDRLYLPTEQLEAITKYTGGESPRLNRLGTAEWEKAKTRARKAVEDIAGELIVLYSKRVQSPGHQFSVDTPWQQELEDAFPYVETPDQQRAIEEVKADMEKPVPMDRVICGDVGFGKTEIAVRAAFKAVQDSKQVAVLVPTTILAQQHHQTFSERFGGFPVKVSQLSRFLSPGEQKEVIEGLAAGKTDVVIGTHRLLQSDLKFHDLGLLVVDEEQRFGVKHKEKIKQLRAEVDVLAMTATPIPRTLEMAVTGIRDLSLIDTAPVDRRPVLTFVGEHDERMIVAAIRRELARDGQVFYVHNRVRSIRGVARKISGLVPGARVEIAHGQMSEDQLERVMIDVWDGKVDVLVCTTIIESGLDIPAMNTLIVERADMLGLSQLYQLRGRVGRARERAYAYLFYPHEAVLGEEAHERLKTLSEFTELGSGFKIALRDLEIRGAGNLLGAEQSGHIAAVGFDLYMRMMGEAIAQYTGGSEAPKLEVRLDLPANAFVPAAYIGRESLRMETYRQIERIRSDKDASELREELTDRYGPIPEPVENLVKVAELRALLAEHAIEEATVRDGVLRLRPLPLLLDSQEVRLRRLYRNATLKEATRTLLLPVPAEDVAGWVLDAARAILGESQ
ncbi:MAG TPA: transcription-repair coupling factor, partial [Actinomycetota bacterium]|nr:transcription-repair coupling factor [Actinomycetota bacterium]